MATFASLLAPQSAAQIRTTVLGLLSSAGFPTTSWQPGSFALGVIDPFCKALELAWADVGSLASNLMIQTSKGLWLRAVAWNHYQEVMPPATITGGKLILEDHGGGPHTIVAGANVFGTSVGGLRFRAASGGTLLLNGTLEIDITAEKAGASSNVPNLAIDTVVSPALPTVTCSNPSIGLTETWITSLGQDQPTEAQFQKLCQLKWQTLTIGSTEGAYEFWALTTPGVSRARINALNPGGANTVWVYIDNALSVAALQATLDAKVPIGTRATAKAATAQNVTVPAVVTIRRSSRAAAEAAIVANLTALAGNTKIGGILVKSEVIEQIMAPTGVTDVAIASSWVGSPNFQLNSSSYPVFTLDLTVLEV